MSAAETAPAPLLSVRELVKSYPAGTFPRREVRAVDGVSFDVRAGEIVALVGESGSGKSTIGRLLARLEPPASGAIHWQGRDVLAERGRPKLAFRGAVQLIFQDPFASLNPARRVHHHLERPLRLHGKAKTRAEVDTQIAHLLETVGLRPAAALAARFPHELSGGQRQRVSLARALAVNPALIIADEPTSMLDASLRGELLTLLASLTRGEGRGLILITHDLGAARVIADRIVVLYAGKIVEAGPTNAVLGAPAHPYTAALLASIPGPAPFVPATATTTLASPESFAHACAYRGRCPRVTDRCRTVRPELEPTAERLVRCHHPEKLP
jgi:peptide/nickel transport system ATP-binding protein